MAVCTFILLAGCAANKKTVDPYQDKPPEVIYETGLQYLNKGNYSDAIKTFQSLDAQYPFNPFTQKGDLGLIYAYFSQDNEAMALATAERFISMYPSNPNITYAYYITGVVHFNNGRGFLQRHFPYDMAEHCITNYEAAYKSFAMLATQYPNSPYTQDARRRMIYLDQAMAQFQLNIATFYLDRKALVAAANRATNVVLHYPNAPQVKSALLIMLQAYHALELPDLTKKTAQIIVLNYPDNAEYQKLKQKWDLQVDQPTKQSDELGSATTSTSAAPTSTTSETTTS